MTLLLVAVSIAAQPWCEGTIRVWQVGDGHACPERVAVCVRVAGYVAEAGAPLALGLALAYHEARFDPSPRRMCSTWQLARRYHCRGCSHRECERAGAALLARLLREERERGGATNRKSRRVATPERRALRRWLRGPAGWRGIDAAGERWLSAVLRTAGGAGYVASAE